MGNYKWEEVAGGADIERFWNGKDSMLSVGDSIEGRYTEKIGDIGENKSNIYVLENEALLRIGVWGSTVLDRKMLNIPTGTMLKIVFDGKKKSEKGGREYKDFKVFKGINETLD